MKKERKALDVELLLLNAGQLDWLPRNPRQWTKQDVERTAKSIAEDPDFLEERPILVVPFAKCYVVFAGNLRHEGARANKMEKVPCVIHYPETEEDYETVKRRAMKDNGSFGEWDYDELANTWDDLPLQDYGIKVWNNKPEQQNMEKGLSTEGREGDEGYDAFREKFNEEN